MYPLLILAAVVFITIAVVLDAGLLHLIIKLLKVKEANFKTTLILTAWMWLITIVLGLAAYLLLAMINLTTLYFWASLLIGFAVLHKLMVKYYHTSLKKNILVYVLSVVVAVIVSLAVIIPVRTWVVEPYYQAGSSMSPTHEDHDYLLINKRSRDFEREDIVVFEYPRDPEQVFVKRIVGLPGEKIQVKDGVVYVFNRDNPEGMVLDEPYLGPNTTTYGLTKEPVELSADEYYVLGDNRNKSKDSRSFGPVTKNLIRGKVIRNLGQ